MLSRRQAKAARPRVALPFAILLLFLSAQATQAGALLTLKQALALAFPGATEVEEVNVFLTKEQQKRAEELSKTKVTSRLWTFYVGRKGKKTLGYAAMDATTVRTMQQAIMVVVDPEGRLLLVEELAFYEPPEYLPPKRWLGQLKGKRLGASLRLGSEIQAISGATLSSRAVMRGVRRVLGVFEASGVAVRKGH